jgi:hypothetical protein
VNRLFVPSSGPSDWRRLLANPSTQWVRGKSAYELAVAWEAARKTERGLPPAVASVLDEHELTRGARLLLGLPELQVEFPGGGHQSQTDLWALLRTDERLISLAVEAKAGEPLDLPVEEWLRGAPQNSGKPARLARLQDLLGLPGVDVALIRYQLLHRSAAALAMAERYRASVAVLVVQAFGGESDSRSKEDFSRFAEVMTCSGSGGLLNAGRATGVPLLLAWLESPTAREVTLSDAI